MQAKRRFPTGSPIQQIRARSNHLRAKEAPLRALGREGASSDVDHWSTPRVAGQAATNKRMFMPSATEERYLGIEVDNALAIAEQVDV
jgi:hypothetical protein